MRRGMYFSEQAEQVIKEYMEANNCNYNRAVNLLVIAGFLKTPVEELIEDKFKEVNSILQEIKLDLFEIKKSQK